MNYSSIINCATVQQTIDFRLAYTTVPPKTFRIEYVIESKVCVSVHQTITHGASNAKAMGLINRE